MRPPVFLSSDCVCGGGEEDDGENREDGELKALEGPKTAERLIDIDLLEAMSGDTPRDGGRVGDSASLKDRLVRDDAAGVIDDVGLEHPVLRRDHRGSKAHISGRTDERLHRSEWSEDVAAESLDAEARDEERCDGDGDGGEVSGRPADAVLLFEIARDGARSLYALLGW